MHHRRTNAISRLATAAATAITVTVLGGPIAGSSLAAQSGAKVLTPPRPADSARTQASRPSAPAAGATANIPAAARPAGPAIPQSAMLDSIREVVFRSLLERDRAGFSTLASAFCLGLSTSDFKKASAPTDRADAPEAMVKRLASPRAPARRASTCTFAPTSPATRPVTGRALLYSVGAIDMPSDGRAEAAAGYNYDGYSAGGFTFSVERTDSAWVVRQWRMEWTGKPLPNAP